MRPHRRALLGALPGLALSACGQGSAGAPAMIGPAPPLKDAAHFPVGTCLMTPELSDPRFLDLARRHFNQITPEWEMKMERVLAEDGTFRFEAADSIADFCRRGGMALHGTTLVWYAQDPPAFKRIIDDRARFENGLRNYALAVMGRYRGLARGWDVLNEAVAEDGYGYRGGIWEQALGPDYARLAFEFAHEADPGAVLFFND
ncbi:MAG: endo-1,4-beta-xylanase, partial [Caulobacteraceae bacterium]|nr:endo-1,4-beta-xylanase [Caulobacteraceae bacterium]